MGRVPLLDLQIALHHHRDQLGKVHLRLPPELVSRLGGVAGEDVDLGGAGDADPELLGALCARYELEIDPSSVPGLIERFGVRFPGTPV